MRCWSTPLFALSSTGGFRIKEKNYSMYSKRRKGKCLQSLALQKKMKYDTVAVADAIYCIRLFLITYSFVAITNQTVNVPLSILN